MWFCVFLVVFSSWRIEREKVEGGEILGLRYG